MKPDRFDAITRHYSELRVALVGDFCLDRYLEIDPARQEVSIETGLPVHNVVRVRSQPGAAGTILNNLVSLGAEAIYPIGFCGEDGEGFELRQCLGGRPGVEASVFVTARDRRTFTYCKPLVVVPGKAPQELNRLDSKNWSATPHNVEDKLIAGLRGIVSEINAVIVMEQVDVPETGVVTQRVLAAIGELAAQKPDLLIIADSRRSLRGYPAVAFKMNRTELAALTGLAKEMAVEEARRAASQLARKTRRPVFVTLSEHGILGADARGNVEHERALPVRGEIDIVGAGDAVMANLAAALTNGASVGEAIKLANTAASVVIHQLGTTGTASREQLRELLCP